MTLLKPKFMILLSIMLGILATYTAYKYLEKQKAQLQEPQTKLKKVVIAQVDLAMGTRLTEQNVAIEEWPVDIIPPGNFEDVNKLINRVVKSNVFKEEIILESKLAPEGSMGGFSSLIPPGKRAMTVPVNVVSGVSGFILPNTRVDVLATASPTQKKEESTTKMILENVLVLAVDQTFQREDDDPMAVQSVTLLIEPEDVEKLALASTEGKIQLTLRNDADRANIATSGINLQELLQRKSAVSSRTRSRRRVAKSANEAPPLPEKQIVEVIRANERTEVAFVKKGS